MLGRHKCYKKELKQKREIESIEGAAIPKKLIMEGSLGVKVPGRGNSKLQGPEEETLMVRV